MTKTALTFRSPHSQEALAKIKAFLLGRPLEGATQQQVADMLELSPKAANRFLIYLLDQVPPPIHIAVKAQRQGRNSPAIYKHGPAIVTKFRPGGVIYRDLPPAFFGGPANRRKKKMLQVEATAGKADMMTDWFDTIQFPTAVRNGPYECKLMGRLQENESDDKSHMRWYEDGHWSYPLQPEHEREDGYKRPGDSHFLPELNVRFIWRGFVEDQEPL